MSTISLIVVTVLVTLVSSAVLGFLIYMGVVVSNLRRTTKHSAENIKAIFNDLSIVNNEINTRSDELVNLIQESESRVNLYIEENQRKADSRYDKLTNHMKA